MYITLHTSFVTDVCNVCNVM